VTTLFDSVHWHQFFTKSTG